ncbi:AzlD domain-containing protein [Acinetobacter sp. MD2(2019)]|uniref:AzlD domain-containing protein n=1 Tax=Acinetobacter sp. MD2(2019) TaxID=2605273 RepID=UPI002D1E65E1|nr:AzlD domain-containing protein [Acinetobacter sp. MD2(2019)]MEB3753999.1 AzlD domain-containing protein [Acinetobacter sp. MD2(2019)]
MTWIMIFTLAAIVFLNRSIFLSPNIKIRFPSFMERMLKYSAPCLLTAICFPVIFFEGEQIRSLPTNAYFYAAIFCIILAYCRVKIIYNVMMSLLIFYSLNFLLSSS